MVLNDHADNIRYYWAICSRYLVGHENPHIAIGFLQFEGDCTRLCPQDNEAYWLANCRTLSLILGYFTRYNLKCNWGLIS